MSPGKEPGSWEEELTQATVGRPRVKLEHRSVPDREEVLTHMHTHGITCTPHTPHIAYIHTEHTQPYIYTRHTAPHTPTCRHHIHTPHTLIPHTYITYTLQIQPSHTYTHTPHIHSIHTLHTCTSPTHIHTPTQAPVERCKHLSHTP